MKKWLIVVLSAIAVHAGAQPYPAKPVRVIVPYPPGGGNDILGRLFVARLGERMGQPFVVENRPGAGTLIGTEAAAQSPPDGRQLSTDPVGNSPEEFAAFVKSELDKYARVIKAAGIKLD